jgi:methyl-accepting chemotaxis protein
MPAMRSSILPATRRPGASSDLATTLTDPANPLRAALDSMFVNCFVADLDLNLIYLNRQAEKTVQGLAPVIHSAFGVELRDLLNGSIHRFHKDPSRIERILEDPSMLPRQAVFSFGGITLRAQINAIKDDSGKKYGYVVIWDNVSERNARAATTFAESEAVTQGLSEVSRTLTATAGDTSQRAMTAASATEEMTRAVQEIARASSEATSQVRRTVEATADNLVKLRELQQMSSEIGDFLRLITGVAEQTKLLALNATIEAARAGEAGKGFAVVADEVKQLAGTTAASIGDIERRIGAIQTAASASVLAVTTIDGLVDNIRDSQETIAAAIEEQSAVTSSIAETISVIAERAKETASQAGQVGSAVKSVTRQTETLREIIENS